MYYIIYMSFSVFRAVHQSQPPRIVQNHRIFFRLKIELITSQCQIRILYVKFLTQIDSSRVCLCDICLFFNVVQDLYFILECIVDDEYVEALKDFLPEGQRDLASLLDTLRCVLYIICVMCFMIRFVLDVHK